MSFICCLSSCLLTSCLLAVSACAVTAEEQPSTQSQDSPADEQRQRQFLQRLENSPWPLGRTPSERIFRDEEGQIIRLQLDGLRLREGDMAVITSFSDLTSLSFSSTNVSNEDLCHLAKLEKLRGLRLNQTRISDEGLEALRQCKQLQSVCLADSIASKEAVARLHEKVKGIGYRPISPQDR